MNREELKNDLLLSGGRIITGLHKLKEAIQTWAEKNTLWYDCHWYTTDQWTARREEVGLNAHLHLVAEGSLNHCLNGHYKEDSELRQEFYAIAEECRFHVEQGYSWTWHFYRQGIAGVFTPWGSVLCLGCHNDLHHSAKRPISLSPFPEVVGKDEGLCACSTCGKEIVERSDVATCKTFVDLVNKANIGVDVRLVHTGGSCVGAEVEFPDGCFGVFYDIGIASGENGGKPVVLFGIYDSEKARGSKEPLVECSWSEEDPKDVFNAVDLVAKVVREGGVRWLKTNA
jgi:hypothetical protein